jgi:Protein  of unknown function (DUF3018)
MQSPVNRRVGKHRDALRAAGLRPVQIWVPDVRSQRMVEECRRQSLLTMRTDATEPDLGSFLDAALDDLLKSEP